MMLAGMIWTSAILVTVLNTAPSVIIRTLMPSPPVIVLLIRMTSFLPFWVSMMVSAELGQLLVIFLVVFLVILFIFLLALVLVGIITPGGPVT